MDLQIPLVEQRLRDSMDELKLPEDDGNDLDIFMTEIVKDEERFQEKRSLIEVGRKYSVPPTSFLKISRRQSLTVTVQKIKCLC